MRDATGLSRLKSDDHNILLNKITVIISFISYIIAKEVVYSILDASL